MKCCVRGAVVDDNHTNDREFCCGKLLHVRHCVWEPTEVTARSAILPVSSVPQIVADAGVRALVLVVVALLLSSLVLILKRGAALLHVT